MDEPIPRFAYTRGARGVVFITWGGRKVRALAGREATKLAEQLRTADLEEAQLLMARHTGNFMHENERGDPQG
ncbi:MAG: hypothetical protein ABR598_08455 [Candidatus Dormibacteria bacterium]